VCGRRYGFQLVHYPHVVTTRGERKENPEAPWVVEVTQCLEVEAFWTREEAETFLASEQPAAWADQLCPRCRK
jgi:hypothetical protein